MTPTLVCPSCGARWHTAARRGRTESAETCLRCGSRLLDDPGDPAVEPQPVAVIGRLIESWSEGELEAILSLCHPEIEIEEIEALVPSGEPRFSGLDGAREWMEAIAATWDVAFRVERRETRVLDPHSVELVNELEARSSKGHPDFYAVTRSFWRIEGGLVRRVEFSVVQAPAPDAHRA